MKPESASRRLLSNTQAKAKMFEFSVPAAHHVDVPVSPTQLFPLLFADLIGAIVKKRLENSTWLCLPAYTDLSVDSWISAIKKETFIKEFWPAQHLLGQQGIFLGKSAVVQMPTSAGKTKATEIIIRSAFLANRTSLAVIIAPFRALCHEIRQSLLYAFQGEAIYVDELSDVFQTDYSIERILRDQNVLVSTPEKFNYVLRHEPGLAEKIGLIIYDEGHQFDNGTRGITYELLLTSLKAKILETTQAVLISAVISNAEQIGKWLVGDGVEIVDGSKLTPSAKSIGFATLADPRRNLNFVQGSNIDEMEYYVPRIFEQYKIEENVVFPNFNNGKEIALFLGVRLAGDLPRKIYPSKMRVERPKKEQLSDETTKTRTNRNLASPS